MSQTVTENLFKDAVGITIPDNVELTVNLTAAPWNRTTVADGWWLQNRTNSAFSARDIYLANCIDELNDAVDELRNGYINSLISMNNVIYSANDYWDGLPPSIAPSNTSKPAPSNTLTYMTIGETTDLGSQGISQIDDRTCIIQGNLTNNSFNQILLSENGIFYRSVSSDNTYPMTGEKVENYDLLDVQSDFCHILDDSTINSAGYWFLHKETEGRPVWTNIHALDEYIDNRVNPDKKYINWVNTAVVTDYNARILTLLPPTNDNINTSIDVTDPTYTQGAYFWSDGGWVSCPPLMSRREIETIVTGGGGGGGGNSLLDFLRLFTENGAQAHYTNYGSFMRSECSTDGYYYFDNGGAQFRLGVGRNRRYAAADTLTVTATAYKVDDTTVQTPITVPQTCKFGNSGTINSNYRLQLPNIKK